MSGDDIRQLPVNKEKSPKPGDLELIYNLFQPKNKQAIAAVASPFKLAFVGAILFGILSLPIAGKLTEMCCKGNPIMAKLALMVVFLTLFFLLQKLWLKA